MKRKIFKALSKLNKTILPNYTKKGLDLQQATTFQKAVIGYKYWVTKNALSESGKHE